MSAPSGYKVSAVDLTDFNERWFCSSCGFVPRLVVQTGLCEHLYCEKCLGAVLRYGLYYWKVAIESQFSMMIITISNNNNDNNSKNYLNIKDALNHYMDLKIYENNKVIIVRVRKTKCTCTGLWSSHVNRNKTEMPASRGLNSGDSLFCTIPPPPPMSRSSPPHPQIDPAAKLWHGNGLGHYLNSYMKYILSNSHKAISNVNLFMKSLTFELGLGHISL